MHKFQWDSAMTRAGIARRHAIVISATCEYGVAATFQTQCCVFLFCVERGTLVVVGSNGLEPCRVGSAHPQSCIFLANAW